MTTFFFSGVAVTEVIRVAGDAGALSGSGCGLISTFSTGTSWVVDSAAWAIGFRKIYMKSGVVRLNAIGKILSLRQ